MAGFSRYLAVASIGLLGCDSNVTPSPATTSSALKAGVQVPAGDETLRAGGLACGLAAQQNTQFGVRGQSLALDVPMSDRMCRLLAPAGVPSPGAISTTTSMSAGAQGTLDGACEASMDVDGRVEVQHQLCGARFTTFDDLSGHADVQHCKDCSGGEVAVCGAASCARSELAGDSRSARGYAFQMPVGDLDGGLGAECDAELVVAIEQSSIFETTDRGAAPCADPETCQQCDASRLELSPSMQMKGTCVSPYGLGSSSSLSGRLSGLLEAEVHSGPDCNSGPGCVTGRLATHVNVPLKVGASDRITMGGEVTVAQYRCRGDWQKDTCESAATGDSWSCNWEFINLWPI